MRTLEAFARGKASEGNRMRVFDWDEAARLIRKNRNAHVGAGLQSDWEWTGGVIFANGEPVRDTRCFLASTWAIPEIRIDGEYQDCWTWKDETSWASDTLWPDSALEILA